MFRFRDTKSQSFYTNLGIRSTKGYFAVYTLVCNGFVKELQKVEFQKKKKCVLCVVMDTFFDSYGNNRFSKMSFITLFCWKLKKTKT